MKTTIHMGGHKYVLEQDDLYVDDTLVMFKSRLDSEDGPVRPRPSPEITITNRDQSRRMAASINRGGFSKRSSPGRSAERWSEDWKVDRAGKDLKRGRIGSTNGESGESDSEEGSEGEGGRSEKRVKLDSGELYIALVPLPCSRSGLIVIHLLVPDADPTLQTPEKTVNQFPGIRPGHPDIQFPFNTPLPPRSNLLHTMTTPSSRKETETGNVSDGDVTIGEPTESAQQDPYQKIGINDEPMTEQEEEDMDVEEEEEGQRASEGDEDNM